LTDVAGGGIVSALSADAGILGGWRLIELAAAGTGEANASINVVPNALVVANDREASSQTTLEYDANGSGLGDLDIFGLGFDSFHFSLVEASLASTLSITLYDGATHCRGGCAAAGDIDVDAVERSVHGLHHHWCWQSIRASTGFRWCWRHRKVPK
jgi:hypothetical protein